MQFFESYAKKRFNSLSHEKGSILWVIFKNQTVQFFASYSRNKGFNSLRHIQEMRSSILWGVFKKCSILSVGSKKSSMMWVIFKKRKVPCFFKKKKTCESFFFFSKKKILESCFFFLKKKVQFFELFFQKKKSLWHIEKGFNS